MQDSYLDQRHYKPNPKRVLEDIQPSGYCKELAGLHAGNVLSLIILTQCNAPSKLTFQHPQNVQLSNGGIPGKQMFMFKYHLQLYQRIRIIKHLSK